LTASVPLGGSYVATNCNQFVRQVDTALSYPPIPDVKAEKLWLAELSLTVRTVTACKANPALPVASTQANVDADYSSYSAGLADLDAALTAP
jgi:hypothetical protein